jgi:hypothetical protein
MAKLWIKCDSISEGMFSDEYCVELKNFDGCAASFFVPKVNILVWDKFILVEVHHNSNDTYITIPSSQPEIVRVNKRIILDEFFQDHINLLVTLQDDIREIRRRYNLG